MRCVWTGQINLKENLGYDINYISIWPFMRHLERPQNWHLSDFSLLVYDHLSVLSPFLWEIKDDAKEVKCLDSYIISYSKIFLDLSWFLSSIWHHKWFDPIIALLWDQKKCQATTLLATMSTYMTSSKKILDLYFLIYTFLSYLRYSVQNQKKSISKIGQFCFWDLLTFSSIALLFGDDIRKY